MTPLFGMEGKRILVIGGGQGMGEATVRLLASLGCDIAIVDLEIDRAERVAADVRSAGARAYPVSFNVTDKAAVVAGIANIEPEFGALDGIRSAPSHAAYGAAKAGLINLDKTMAVEWGDDGIRVNVVAPGGIVTPRLPVTDPDAERESMALLPMLRRGTVDDIVKAIAFFLSDMSSYITGQTLAVDGGYTAIGVFEQRRMVAPGTTLGVA